MNEFLQPVVRALVDRFGIIPEERRDQLSLNVKPEHIAAVCHVLRDEFSFERRSGLTAVDYWPVLTPRFHIVYQLHSLSQAARLELRVPVNEADPCVHTIEHIYPNAYWHERETWDMFGIRFEGHSDLRRILCPDDWEGYPLRKDYKFPTSYRDMPV